MVTLHQHAAVLVTTDQEALDELLATASLRTCLGPRLTPNVAWVDHRRVEALREALARAGYTLRVVRDAGP